MQAYPLEACLSPLREGTECCENSVAHTSHILQAVHKKLAGGGSLCDNWGGMWPAHGGARWLHPTVRIHPPSAAEWLAKRWWPNAMLAGHPYALKSMLSAGVHAGFTCFCVPPTHGGTAWRKCVRSLMKGWREGGDRAEYGVPFLPSVLSTHTPMQMTRAMKVGTPNEVGRAARAATADKPVLVLLDADSSTPQLRGVLEDVQFCAHALVVVYWSTTHPGAGVDPLYLPSLLERLCRDKDLGFCVRADPEQVGHHIEALVRSAVMPLGPPLFDVDGEGVSSSLMHIANASSHGGGVVAERGALHDIGSVACTPPEALTAGCEVPRMDAILALEGRVQFGGHVCQTRWEETDCSICMDGIMGGYVVELLPCQHVFHIPCVGDWFEHSDSVTCPVCKGEAEQGVIQFFARESEGGDGGWRAWSLWSKQNRWGFRNMCFDIMPERVLVVAPTREGVELLVRNRLQSGYMAVHEKWDEPSGHSVSIWVLSAEWLALGGNAEVAEYLGRERRISRVVWGVADKHTRSLHPTAFPGTQKVVVTYCTHSGV